jgi:hypothetical protein
MRLLKVLAAAAGLSLSIVLIMATSQSATSTGPVPNDSHKAIMLGFEEVPAVSSTGTGELRLKINELDQVIDYELTYRDLEGTTTNASHIHIAQPSVIGGVVAFLCGGGGKPACTPTSGAISGSIVPADIVAGASAQGVAAGEWSEVVRAIRAGATYVNVHTDKHTSGEIRGQIK